MKNVIISILVCFLPLTQCQSPINDSCATKNLESQRKALKEFGDYILANNPVLEKITEHDNLEIDTTYKQRLEGFFSGFCKELFSDKSFERFSLVYWYNVKYNQYKCCAPAESEIIPPSFLDKNHEDSRNIFAVTLYCLLQKNKITKGSLENGFTQSSLNFIHSLESNRDDVLLDEFIEKVNQTQEQAYQLRK